MGFRAGVAYRQAILVSKKRERGRAKFLVILYIWIAVPVIGYAIHWSRQPHAGRVQDEALLAGRDASSFHAAEEDYSYDMAGGIDFRAGAPENDKGAFVKGRNTWLVWPAAMARLWNTLIYRSAGALDFLKVLSSHPELLKIDPRFSRDGRWQYLGLVNDPCFEKPTGPDPERWGLWLDKRRADCKPDPFENEQKYPGAKIGSRGTKINGKDFPVGSFYGYETGIVGLRLFPNPDFDETAAKNWDASRYYTDKDYYESKHLVRPYRVGMSCGFCHVGPNPLKPPKDPNSPKWENLSSNVGAQYFWIDRIFYWEGEKDNFVWQLFRTSRPGSLDTSFVSTDNINNPRTMNAVYMLGERLEHARRWGKETLAGRQQNNKQFNEYIKEGPLTKFYQATDTVWTPRVLKDGADSVGALGALNRVYLNIGTFSEEWLLHFNPLVGGKPITPIEIKVARANSSYFAATEMQTPATAAFFLKTTEPHHLKDAKDGAGAKYLKEDPATLTRGKIAFAENCARCHSSKLPEASPGLDPNGCAGKDYVSCWNKYWEWTKTSEFKEKMRKIVLADDFLKDNYLSAEFRVPVTLLHTNACSPLATNALGNNIWDNFSSQSYKELPSVGEITWYHPVTGAPNKYTMPAGGAGFPRPPAFVTVGSTAPLLSYNTVGPFVVDPSVDGRIRSFEASIEEMLWPDRGVKDGKLGDKVPGTIDRTTTRSYIRVSRGYLPDVLQPFFSIGQSVAPWLFGEGGIEIGPIPAGSPVGLLANLNPLSEGMDLSKRVERDKRLATLVLDLAADLKKLEKNVSDEQADAVLVKRVDELLALSKCPDLVVNRGHYFGTDYL